MKCFDTHLFENDLDKIFLDTNLLADDLKLCYTINIRDDCRIDSKTALINYIYGAIIMCLNLLKINSKYLYV